MVRIYIVILYAPYLKLMSYSELIKFQSTIRKAVQVTSDLFTMTVMLTVVTMRSQVSLTSKLNGIVQSST